MKDNMRLYCIRGAVGTDNNADSIIKNVGDMLRAIVKDNCITAENIVSIQFTMTKDIDALNAATGLRRSDIGIDVSHVPLFCSQEPEIIGMPRKLIRTMVTVYLAEGTVTKPSYLNGAEVLRPDLAKAKNA